MARKPPFAEVLLSCLIVSGTLTAWCSSPSPAAPQTHRGASRSEGLAAWRQVYSVLISPRCLNCHTASAYPEQGDDRHRHLVNVVRGPQGHGVPALRCVTCHQSANADSTGVPGAKDWHLAPLSMAWQDREGRPLSSAAVCRIVSNPSTNGHMDGPGLIRHMAEADLVKWAWQPGRRRDGTARAVPPVGHDALVNATRVWVQAGMPCPTSP